MSFLSEVIAAASKVVPWDKAFVPADEAFGDRRYKYVAFKDLKPADQKRVPGQYPHTGGKSGAKYDFAYEHYHYPVNKKGDLAHARRSLAIPHAKINDEKYMEKLGYSITDEWKSKSETKADFMNFKGTLVLMKNPAGSYSFVGSVPAELAYVAKDGGPLTPELKERLNGASNPGMIAKSRVFKTADDARAAAKKLGVKITQDTADQ